MKYDEWLKAMRTEYGSIVKVSDACGISRDSLYRWKRIPGSVTAVYLRKLYDGGFMSEADVLDAVLGGEEAEA